MDAVKILTGDEAILAVRALNDESRRQILHALRARRMTTTELCEFMDRQDPKKDVKPQTVRYHLKELERSGLIRQDGYAPTGNGDSHIQQKQWRATAESIFIATGDMESLPDRVPFDLERTLDLVGTVRGLGFHLADDATVEDLAQLFVEHDGLWQRGRDSAKRVLENIPEIEPTVYVTLRRLLTVVTLNNQDYLRYWEVAREMTDKFRRAFRNGKGTNPEVY